jgi:hypothetical protein
VADVVRQESDLGVGEREKRGVEQAEPEAADQDENGDAQNQEGEGGGDLEDVVSRLGGEEPLASQPLLQVGVVGGRDARLRSFTFTVLLNVMYRRVVARRSGRPAGDG